MSGCKIEAENSSKTPQHIRSTRRQLQQPSVECVLQKSRDPGEQNITWRWSTLGTRVRKCARPFQSRKTRVVLTKDRPDGKERQHISNLFDMGVQISVIYPLSPKHTDTRKHLHAQNPVVLTDMLRRSSARYNMKHCKFSLWDGSLASWSRFPCSS